VLKKYIYVIFYFINVINNEVLACIGAFEVNC
jgi:hypothetical protein